MNATISAAFKTAEVWPLVHLIVPFSVACVLNPPADYSAAGVAPSERASRLARVSGTFLQFLAIIYLFETFEFLLGEQWAFWQEGQADRIFLDIVCAAIAYTLHIVVYAVNEEKSLVKRIGLGVLFTPIVFGCIMWGADAKGTEGWSFLALIGTYTVANLLSMVDVKDEQRYYLLQIVVGALIFAFGTWCFWVWLGYTVAAVGIMSGLVLLVTVACSHFLPTLAKLNRGARFRLVPADELV
jgi:hypothetical protein